METQWKSALKVAWFSYEDPLYTEAHSLLYIKIVQYNTLHSSV